MPRSAAGRGAEPSAAVLDGRTLRSTPEGGAATTGPSARGAPSRTWRWTRPGTCRRPAAVDDRAEVGRSAEAVQAATGEGVEVALVDRGHTGEEPARAAREHGIELRVVEPPGAERGFVLPPRRRVAERTFARAARFRRLVRDHERSPQTLADLRVVALVCTMLERAARLAPGP